MGRFMMSHSCMGFAMGVHPCTMGRFMMSHSYRMDTTMDKLSYCHSHSHGKHPKPGPQLEPAKNVQLLWRPCKQPSRKYWHCKKNLQWVGYNYMEITTALASSTRNHERHPAPAPPAAPGPPLTRATTWSPTYIRSRFRMKHSCVRSRILTNTRSRFRKNHTCRMAASTIHRLS